MLRFPAVLETKAFLPSDLAATNPAVPGAAGPGVVLCKAPDPIILLALNANYCCHRFLSGIYSIIFNKNGADSHLGACCTLPEVVVSHPFAQQKSNPKNRDQLGSSPIITVSRSVTQVHHATDKMSVFLFFLFFSYREHTGDELLLNSPFAQVLISVMSGQDQ